MAEMTNYSTTVASMLEIKRVDARSATRSIMRIEMMIENVACHNNKTIAAEQETFNYFVFVARSNYSGIMHDIC